MYVKLTTQEKLKDLRVARKLTLKQLEAEVGEKRGNHYELLPPNPLEKYPEIIDCQLR